MKKKSGVPTIKSIKCDEPFRYKWKILAIRDRGYECVFYHVYKRSCFMWFYQDLFLKPEDCLIYIKAYERIKKEKQNDTSVIKKEIWRSK